MTASSSTRSLRFTGVALWSGIVMLAMCTATFTETWIFTWSRGRHPNVAALAINGITFGIAAWICALLVFALVRHYPVESGRRTQRLVVHAAGYVIAHIGLC